MKGGFTIQRLNFQEAFEASRLADLQLMTEILGTKPHGWQMAALGKRENMGQNMRYGLWSSIPKGSKRAKPLSID